MLNIYESVVIKKTGKLGVIQGIMPRKNGFKYYVVTQHGKRFYKESKIIKLEKLEKYDKMMGYK